MIVGGSMAQQLKLGAQPSLLLPSAVLELSSDNQGLLLPRLTDTAYINLLSPPDGMMIYHASARRLMARSAGHWRALTYEADSSRNWLVNGNVTGAVKKIGSIDNFPLVFITHNAERLRLTSSGHLGVGTTTPSTLLHVKAAAHTSGLRLESLTNASPPTTDAAVLGIDGSGHVVVAKRPVYYSGTGTSATLNAVTKIWLAEVSNTSNGIQTINIPSNVGFSSVMNIQLTAKGGGGTTDAPIAMVTSNTTSSVTIRVLESRTSSILIGGSAEGLEVHNDVNTKIYIRVEGN